MAIEDTTTHVKRRVKVFSRFERFWHWSQATLIVVMMITGFEVNGGYELLGYAEAARWHRIAAWILIGIWVFAFFWLIVSGEWKQYRPTFSKLFEVAKFYSIGIFHPGSEHPYKKTRRAKHNPMQRLAYLTFIIGITPVIWISGLMYMFYNDWEHLGMAQSLSLGTVAFIHTAAAFAMLTFFIAHVYMVFTCSPLTKYLKAMMTGCEEVYVHKDYFNEDELCG